MTRSSATPAREARIDRQLNGLLDLIVARIASEDDWAAYHHLTFSRMALMMAPYVRLKRRAA